MSVKLFTFAAAAVLICGPAFAAETSVAQVSAVQGPVLASQNGKMISAGAASLKAGDRVVTSANGSASVKFADGCVVSVKPASMITISAKSPCASGVGLVATQSNPQEFSEATAGWVAGGVFVLGSAGAIIAGNDQNDGPASP